ncbi:MAG: hypothetical protein KF873_03515 [Gemmataceae bacterium]|nr:hypothetical protein [Gemmataceae bacterium]
MIRSLAILLLLAISVGAADKPPIYLWYEPEWFDGVEGSFAYWTGEAKPTGKWGVAGPGISAEWTQGGESEWNSMGAAGGETKASCGREIVVPRAGKFRAWVRYVDHRRKSEPFTIALKQNGKAVLAGELGTQPIVPENDEYQLYWGFSFGWTSVDGDLAAGPARLEVSIDKPGDGWRQIDAILITDDLSFLPNGREKPLFAYRDSFSLQPKNGAAWRGSAKGIAMDCKRPQLARRDYTMWAGIEADTKTWEKLKIDVLTKYDVFFNQSTPTDIREKFAKQFAGRRDLPILSWPGLVPGLYLGASPDLSPGSPLRMWLEKSKTPFYIMTNYASPTYTDKSGPATYQALTGPLANQFLGYIHGEALATSGIGMPAKPLAPTRRAHLDAMMADLRKQQAEAWTKFYKTPVPEEHWAKGISCLSVDSIALAHAYHESGTKVVGYELDATNVHAPMRIAFERGAARQYGGSWINYASGNFGDACNYFTQIPVVPRGAPGWFHSKYAITDGVSIGWYRKMYYLNFLSGAAATFWEQGLGNQWMQPGPGTHSIQLSPFGRATEEFQAFVTRLPDRGEPIAPVGVLLSAGHGYERVNYTCKMLHHFAENAADRELRELFNVLWHPVGVVEGQSAAPDVQSLPNGRYGNIFDVLVDRPNKADAIHRYPVLIAAGNVDLSRDWPKNLEEYVRKGGTFVVNADAALGKLPESLLGLKLTGSRKMYDAWKPGDSAVRACVPYECESAELRAATALATASDGSPILARHAIGEGAVIVSLIPGTIGLDERAHPALPWLVNGLTDGLLPVDVRLANGHRPNGEVLYQVNETANGYLVLLMNNRGVDKTPSGVARVDRRQYVDVILKSKFAAKAAMEWTSGRAMELRDDTVRVRVHPGDVQVIGFRTK